MEDKEVRLLKCPIPEAELLTLGEKLASEVKAVAAIKEDRKLCLADFKSRIDEIQKQIADLAEKVDTGMGERQVECLWTNNHPEPGMKSLARIDTCEVVEMKPMTLLDGTGVTGSAL